MISDIPYSIHKRLESDISNNSEKSLPRVATPLAVPSSPVILVPARLAARAVPAPAATTTSLRSKPVMA